MTFYTFRSSKWSTKVVSIHHHYNNRPPPPPHNSHPFKLPPSTIHCAQTNSVSISCLIKTIWLWKVMCVNTACLSRHCFLYVTLRDYRRIYLWNPDVVVSTTCGVLWTLPVEYKTFKYECPNGNIDLYGSYWNLHFKTFRKIETYTITH